jgi:hypothetical protein
VCTLQDCIVGLNKGRVQFYLPKALVLSQMHLAAFPVQVAVRVVVPHTQEGEAGTHLMSRWTLHQSCGCRISVCSSWQTSKLLQRALVQH